MKFHCPQHPYPSGRHLLLHPLSLHTSPPSCQISFPLCVCVYAFEASKWVFAPTPGPEVSSGSALVLPKNAMAPAAWVTKCDAHWPLGPSEKSREAFGCWSKPKIAPVVAHQYSSAICQTASLTVLHIWSVCVDPTHVLQETVFMMENMCHMFVKIVHSLHYQALRSEKTKIQGNMWKPACIECVWSSQ